jgi:hypothetical protein
VTTHAAAVLLGFALQLAMGVAWAAFPRRQGSRGDPRVIWTAYGLLNGGILAAVGASLTGTPGLGAAGLVSAVAGAVCFAAAVWARVRAP